MTTEISTPIQICPIGSLASPRKTARENESGDGKHEKNETRLVERVR